MNNVLDIKKLNLFIGPYQVLYDVNLSLKKGTMTSLVGESGCGKTMTAMSILKLLPKNAVISEGEILFQGNNILKYTESQMQKIRGNQIALIPQDPMTALNPLYTIKNQLLENIFAHQKTTGKEAINKIMDVLDAVKLPDAKNKINMYPHEFSGGMKQRIIIAMALACNADLIIADEPTTALDVTIQKEIISLLNNIKKEFNTSIILISHDLALVSNYADEVNVMYSGHIVEKGTSDLFFKNTMHPYSIALLNSLPSNNPTLKLKTIEGAPPNIREEIFGCKFHPRCEFFQKGLCDTKKPELTEKQMHHYSACFLK